MKVISIFGGTGFIGSELIDFLPKKKIEIRVFTHSKNKVSSLNSSHNVKFFYYKQPKDVQSKISGSDLIINLVGILHESKNIKFVDAHQKLTRSIINVALKEKVKRYVHLSALKADTPGNSKYLSSKFDSEDVVEKYYNDGKWTILRPSVVFGNKDSFINLFEKMVKYLPLIFLISPKAKFQPIYVKDLVHIIERTLYDKNSYNKKLNLGGPNILSFIEILQLIMSSQDKKNILIPLNKSLSYLFVRILELLPFKIITRDNLKSMEVDNTSPINDSYLHINSLLSLESYLSKTKKL